GRRRRGVTRTPRANDLRAPSDRSSSTRARGDPVRAAGCRAQPSTIRAPTTVRPLFLAAAAFSHLFLEPEETRFQVVEIGLVSFNEWGYGSRRSRARRIPLGFCATLSRRLRHGTRRYNAARASNIDRARWDDELESNVSLDEP